MSYLKTMTKSAIAMSKIETELSTEINHLSSQICNSLHLPNAERSALAKKRDHLRKSKSLLILTLSNAERAIEAMKEI